MRTGLLLLAVIGVAFSLTFEVQPNRQECFFEDVNAGSPVTGSFHVTKGGSLDVDAKVYAPDESVIYEANRESEGRFSFSAPATGVYRFCFGNHMSSMTVKTVLFRLEASTKMEGSVAKQEDLTPLEQSIVKLSEGLSSIQAEQRYMRQRERRHRNTAESTNSRVFWWSLFQAMVLVAVSLWQVYYLRRFFSTKRPI